MSCLSTVVPSSGLSCVQNQSALASTKESAFVWIARVAVLTAAMLVGLTASAQVQFGSQAIGSSTTQSVSVTVAGGATVSAVQVLTQGAQGQDFQASGTFNCAAQTCIQPVTFAPLYPGARVGAVVALDSANNVLGTTYLSGTGNGGLGVLIPGTATTVAGDGDWKAVGDDEPATSTELFLPASVALDGAGNMYIADSAHNRIRIVCAGTGPAFPGITCRKAGYIYTVAGTQGTSGYAGDGQASIASGVELSTPSGIAIDGAGNLYIADTSNHVVREISASTGIITTIAGTGVRGFGGDGGAATAAQLHSPTGVAVDASGNVFVSDSENNRIRVICAGSSPVLGVGCAAGNIVTVAGGTATTLGDGAAATAAMLSTPYTIALDAAGNLYIADSDNHRVRAVCATATTVLGVSCAATGIIETVAGNGMNAFAGDGGPAINAELYSPSGVVVDPAGNLYIADTQNFRIRKVNASGTITSVAGTGVGSFGGDGGPATAAGIYGPYGLALDGSGNLFIASYLDNRVREIQANLSVANFQSNPVRQGSTSPTMNITVENDGTGLLDLANIQAGTNSATDPAATTCAAGGSLTMEAQCVVGAVFAPASKPALTSNQTETGDISVSDQAVAGVAGSNSPLVIHVIGTATPVNSTTVVLTSSLNPSSFGQSVMFSAAVTTGQGTGALTGTVNFYNGTTKLQSGVALNSSGVATFSIPSLPVGVNSITATYNEDGKDQLHFASTSDPLSQVVQEQTAVTVTSSANPSGLGTVVTFTAIISTPGGGGVTPDGTVNFLDAGNLIGSGTVSGGVATFATSNLSDGQHNITAVYSGDATNYIIGSTSAVLKQDVLAASTVALTASPANTSVYGTSVTFTATVTGSTSVTPTGTVNFLDGTTKLGSATLNAGVATFATSSLSAGVHAITAAYLGDLNSGPGTSGGLAFTVTQTPTTTSVTASPTPGIAGKAVALVATVKMNSGTALSSGTVTFTDGSTTLGSAAVGAGGTASIAPVLAPGAHAIVASYGGDANDAASSSSALPLAVNLATTAVAVTSSGSPVTVLSSITFTATVTGNGGTPTGTVVFSVDGAAAQTVTLTGGQASFSDAALTVGNHTIAASYGGDTNDNASSSSALTQVVQAISTTTSLGTASTGGPNPQVILVASVVGASGPTPTGTVVFMNGSAVIGTATLDSNGVGSLIPDLAPATYNITAQYSGDADHGPSTSGSVKVSGTPVGFGITVNPASVSVAASQNITVTVNVNSNNGFSDTIGLGCGTLPAAVNCHFSDASVALKADGTASVQLTIDTNNPLGGGATAMNTAGKGGLSLAGLFLPAGLLLGWIGWRFRKRNALFFAAGLVLLLSGSLGLTGCGTGFSQKTAAPGTYSIQVNAVGTNSNITHYQTITLTITK